MKQLPISKEDMEAADAEALPTIIEDAAKSLTDCLSAWYDQTQSPLTDDGKDAAHSFHKSGTHLIHDPNDGQEYGQCNVAYGTLLKLVSAARILEKTQSELKKTKTELHSCKASERELREWILRILPRPKSSQSVEHWLELYDSLLRGTHMMPHDKTNPRTPAEALKELALITKKSPGAIYQAFKRYEKKLPRNESLPVTLPGNPDK